MAENKKPKEHLSWWYFLAKYVMLFFFKILHPYRIIGRENMPLTGKLLVCSNHVTMGDPIYLGCAIPKRQLHYMAKAELFEMMAPYFREKGFYVKAVNFLDMAHSDGWNCLAGLDTNPDLVNTVANTLLQKTSGPKE